MYLRNRMGSGWGEGIKVGGKVLEITGEKTNYTEFDPYLLVVCFEVCSIQWDASLYRWD